MKKHLTFIALSMALAACSSTPKTSADASAAPASSAQASAATQAVTAAKDNTGNPGAMVLNSVYFDTDRSDIKAQFRDAVKQQAEYLKAHKNDVVAVEGNTDERGSDEYNLALGHRRATAVHRMLVVMGIPEKRIKDVSFGKEKPQATCHEEKCWEQNRRVDFVHKQG